jgi:hypothetical protein
MVMIQMRKMLGDPVEGHVAFAREGGPSSPVG